MSNIETGKGKGSHKEKSQEGDKDWKLGMSPYIDKTRSKKLNINFGEDMSSINQDVNVERASGAKAKTSDEKVQIYKFS